MKIILDKYYTPKDTAKKLIDKTFDIIGKNNISEIIEPAAGNGSFSSQIDNCIAFDIEPDDTSIIKQDFLELNLEYKKNRLFIGNPPFGNRGWLLYKFYKKCIEAGDYIAFIMPAKFFNYQGLYYHFDLIYSEQLKGVKFSDRDLNCSFNIYRRNPTGLNKKKIITIPGVEVIRWDRNIKDPKILSIKGDPDLRICGWGSRVGYKSEYPGQFAREFLIYIDESIQNKQLIIDEIQKFNWNKLGSISATSITNTQIMEFIKQFI